MGEAEVQLRLFLISAMDGDEWSDPRPGRFPRGTGDPGTLK